MKKTFLLCVVALGAVFTRPAVAQTVTTIAGTGATGMSSGSFGGDGGAATAANLYDPCSIAFDASGNLIFSDNRNARVRKITPAGIITTIAGTGVSGFSGDGGPATAAKLTIPGGLAFDAHHNLYVTDGFNARVRKIDTNGIITTVAGNGTSVFAGDGGPATAASFQNPDNVAFDSIGNMYISDWQNNRLRKVDTFGIVRTIAGNGSIGFGGDGGPATAAGLSVGTFLFDRKGNILLGDPYNHRIRKIDTAGIITTFAGNGTAGFAGDGGPASAATFYSPDFLIYGPNGSIILSDELNHKLRKIDTNGIVSTIAGTTEGFSGDGGPASAAQFNYPTGMAFDASGYLYVADLWNNRIRRIQFPGMATTVGVSAVMAGLLPVIYPNPTTGLIHILNLKSGTKYMLMGIGGTVVISGTFENGEGTLSLEQLAHGSYILTLTDKDGGFDRSVIVKE